MIFRWSLVTFRWSHSKGPDELQLLILNYMNLAVNPLRDLLDFQALFKWWKFSWNWNWKNVLCRIVYIYENSQENICEVHGCKEEFVENGNITFQRIFEAMPENIDHHIHVEEKALNFNCLKGITLKSFWCCCQKYKVFNLSFKKYF